MKPSNCMELSKQILDDPTQRYCEIYKITNLENNKMYVGQAVSHILNHKRYRPYGYFGRFKCHISEAFSQKPNQSQYLNNAIKKYGVENFEVELIEYCECKDADDRERYYISQLNTLFPNGYNLISGGQVFEHTDESKKRVSEGVHRYYKEKKYERFKEITYIDDDIKKYIHPLNKYGDQYGWYVLINRKKADFGGIHISLEDSYNQAIEFINNLKEQIQIAKHLDAGNSLEPSTTTL